ncbi:MAG: response regulator [Acidobacteriota bacterium]|nr:response regulator [Blastocatellia bacterium]MDW8411389.1 response regulator [Acidobacteriota bacterium]
MSKRILVVDDEEGVRKLFRQLFVGRGYEVVEAENGKVAVEIAALQLPDLVVIDLVMPVMNGVEATKQIRKMPGGENVPIIAVTAYSLSELVIHPEETSLWDAIVLKPVELDKLCKVSEELFSDRLIRST